MSEIGNLAKLQEENRKALLERQQRLLTWEKFKKDYESLEEILTSLPKKISHEALVPLNSVAFMPGKLVHTNEIMVLLGDNWFAERSACQALEILERRKKYLESNIAGINEDIKAFQSRLEFTADIQAAAQENSEVKEIKEEMTLLEAERVTSRSSRTAHPKAQKVGGSRKVEGLKSTTKINSAKDKRDEHHFSSEDLSLFARLDELEMLEEKNAEFNQLEEDTFDNERYNKMADIVKKEEIEGELLQNNAEGNWHCKTEKKVTWQADFNRNGANESSTSEEDDEEESPGNTICVVFTASTASTKQGKIPHSLSHSSALVTPGDIYGHFMYNQGPKPILKKPTVEENTQHTSADKAIGETHLENPTGRLMENTDTSYQKAFSGTIVERQGLQRDQYSCEQSLPPQAGKKLSRFKASRQ